MAVNSADSALHVLGVDLEANDASALHEVGLVVDTKNGRAVYAKAGTGAFAVGALSLVAPSSATATQSVVATLVSTGNVNSAPGFFAFNQASIAAAQYGWFYTEGRQGVRVKTLIAAQPWVPLYTTATGGVLDDAIVSAGRIEGVRVLTSATSASAPAATFANITHLVQDIA